MSKKSKSGIKRIAHLANRAQSGKATMEEIDELQGGEKAPASKRIRPGKTEAAIKKLDDTYTSAQAKLPQRRTGAERALLTFIEAHQQPYKERGDIWLKVIQDVGAQLIGVTEPSLEAIPATVKEMRLELQRLKADRSNTEDMKMAVARIVKLVTDINPTHVAEVYHNHGVGLAPLYGKPIPTWAEVPEPIRQLAAAAFKELRSQMLNELQKTGILAAIEGTPMSDLGKMRDALQRTDRGLTDLVKSLNEKAPRAMVTTLWELIHASRNGLKAAPEPDQLELMRAHHANLVRMFADIRITVIATDPTFTSEEVGMIQNKVIQLMLELLPLRSFVEEEREMRVLLTREVTANEEMAVHFSKGLEYYRGLLDEIAKNFGEDAYIAQDGSKMDSVLRAKMPDLVKQLTQERDAMKARENPLWYGMIRRGRKPGRDIATTADPRTSGYLQLGWQTPDSPVANTTPLQST